MLICEIVRYKELLSNEVLKMLDIKMKNNKIIITIPEGREYILKQLDNGEIIIKEKIK